MISSSVHGVMARIGQLQDLAERSRGSFAGVLGAAFPTEPIARHIPAEASPATQSFDAPPPVAGRWQASIERAARAEGIDPRLLTALVWVESGFVADAVSHAGAVGLTQLMPDTADLLGVDPYDPEQNLAGGARFLRSMIDRFGRVDLALAAYNAGPARIAREYDGGPGVPVVPGYVEAVFDRYRQLGGTP